jgi:hypothetical protein
MQFFFSQHIMMNERAADCASASSEFALCTALEWQILPEMPFAPPESDFQVIPEAWLRPWVAGF